VWIAVAFTEAGVEAAAAETEGSPGERAATREGAGAGETAHRQTCQTNMRSVTQWHANGCVTCVVANNATDQRQTES